MQHDINSRSQIYFIARGWQRCESCQKMTSVVGLMVPAGHETLETDAHTESDTCAADAWEAADHDAILFDVEYLPGAIQNRLRQVAPHYRASATDATGRSNWMNHCSFCGAQQADFDLFCEPEGAFVPISATAAAKLRLITVREPFEALVSGYGYAPEFLEYAQQDARID
jgi:hypothetical protein